MRIVVGMLCASLLAACATHGDVVRVAATASGRPEAVFAGRTPDQVQGLVASGCMDRGHIVVSSSANQVQCQIEMGAMQSALTQMLIGNSYSTTPQQFVRFVITPTASGTRVQAQMWVQTQMAFGQMQQQELNGNVQFNSIQLFLHEIGGVAPGAVQPVAERLSDMPEATPAPVHGAPTSAITVASARSVPVSQTAFAANRCADVETAWGEARQRGDWAAARIQEDLWRAQCSGGSR